jgi:hypothetical protein
MRFYLLLIFLCGCWVYAVTHEDDFKRWCVKQVERLQRIWTVASSQKDKWGDDWCSEALKHRDGKDSEAAQRINAFRHGKCPHCGQTNLRSGPRAPGAQNILCADCGSKFNNTIMGVDLLRDCTDPIPEIKDDSSTASPSGLKLASHNREGPIARTHCCAAASMGATHNCTCPRRGNGQDPPPQTEDDGSVPPPGARRAAIEATKKKRAAEGRS